MLRSMKSGVPLRLPENSSMSGGRMGLVGMITTTLPSKTLPLVRRVRASSCRPSMYATVVTSAPARRRAGQSLNVSMA